jgi:hypothetical protein
MRHALGSLLAPSPPKKQVANSLKISPYSEHKAYVNSAVAIHPIEVPCLYFSKTKVEKNGFWEAASFISGLWDKIKAKKSMAKSVEADAGAFIKSWENRRWGSFLLERWYRLS